MPVQLLGLGVGRGLDLRGLLFGQRQHVLDPDAQVAVRGLVAGRAAPAQLLDLRLKLLHLDHEPVDLRQCLGALAGERVHLQLHRRDVPVHLPLVVSAQRGLEPAVDGLALVETGQQFRVIAEFVVTRHTLILT